MDINLTLSLSDDIPVTWGKLQEVLAYNTPANKNLVIATGQGPFVVDAGGFGIAGKLTVSESQDKLAIAAATERVLSYLDELDRIESKSNGLKQADDVHSINDLELRRSDLRLIFGDTN